MINYGEGQEFQVKVTVEGESVHLVDFSLGGLYFLSEKNFSKGDIVGLSIDLENRGKIDLLGKIVRVQQERDSNKWGIAVDLSQTYNMKPVRKA
jgi:Tfp pilus assembly protein PilZ